MNQIMITQAELKEILHYNPETGLFVWLINHSRIAAGSVAGYSTSHGYTYITINSKMHATHRLAFLYMEGKFPTKQVDHINHNRSDNRWRNLRHATNTENSKNKSLSRRNTSGMTGVQWIKKMNKWKVRICVNNKELHLGCFTELSDAVAAREAANIKYNFHQNHGQ